MGQERGQSSIELERCEKISEKDRLKIKITTNRHYQNVDLGLKFPMEALKLQKQPSRTTKNTN